MVWFESWFGSVIDFIFKILMLFPKRLTIEEKQIILRIQKDEHYGCYVFVSRNGWVMVINREDYQIAWPTVAILDELVKKRVSIFKSIWQKSKHKNIQVA